MMGTLDENGFPAEDSAWAKAFTQEKVRHSVAKVCTSVLCSPPNCYFLSFELIVMQNIQLYFLNKGFASFIDDV
jgi:hypothetical protein